VQKCRRVSYATNAVVNLGYGISSASFFLGALLFSLKTTSFLRRERDLQNKLITRLVTSMDGVGVGRVVFKNWDAKAILETHLFSGYNAANKLVEESVLFITH
jgi:hypothetical protein